MPKKKKWDVMSDDEKLAALTNVLTLAGSDDKFRKRCLASKQAAKDAVEEEGGIEFPKDFTIEFLMRDQARKRLVFYMPDFKPTPPAIVHPAEEFTPCSYSPWAPKPSTPAALEKWLNAL